MLKAERYKERIKELNYSFALCEGEMKDCESADCENCKFVSNSGCTTKKVKWLLEEYKEPLLTDEGINFLKEHIKQSGAIAVYIKITKKVDDYCDYRLEIRLETGLISIPFAKRSNLYKMFKEVEIGQDYLPEELGL